MFKGSIVALVTPMKEGTVDYDSLIKLVHWHLEAGTHAIVAGGTTGESLTLSHDEKIQVIKTVVEVAGKHVPVIAGTGMTATQDTISLSEEAMALGAHAVLVMTPGCIKPTQEGLYAHYSLLAKKVPIPIILYNVPSRTVSDLLPETVGRLSHLSNIVGIKDATGSLTRLTLLKEAVGDRMDIFSGDDPTAAQWLLEGARGVISVTANICPTLVAKMADAAFNNERAHCLGFDETLKDLHQLLFVEANPIPAKWALYKMGWIQNEIRLPLTPLSSSYQASLLSALQQLDIRVGV